MRKNQNQYTTIQSYTHRCSPGYFHMDLEVLEMSSTNIQSQNYSTKDTCCLVKYGGGFKLEIGVCIVETYGMFYISWRKCNIPRRCTQIRDQRPNFIPHIFLRGQRTLNFACNMV